MTDSMSNSQKEKNESISKNGYTPEQGAIAARELLNGVLLFHRTYGEQFMKSAIREADILLSPTVRESSFYLVGFIRDSISGYGRMGQSELNDKLKSLVRYFQILKILSHHKDVSFEDLLNIYPSKGFEEDEKYKLAIDHLLHGFHFVYLQNVLLQSDFSTGFHLEPLPRVNGVFTNSMSTQDPVKKEKHDSDHFDDTSETSNESVSEDTYDDDDDEDEFKSGNGNQIIGSKYESYESPSKYVLRGDLEMIGAENDGKKSVLRKVEDATLKYSGINYLRGHFGRKKKGETSEEPAK